MDSEPATAAEVTRVSARTVNIGRIEATIVLALRQEPGGMTWDELSSATKIAKASISPRLKPLRARGLITWMVEDGYKMTRAGKSGKQQQVWRAVPWGK